MKTIAATVAVVLLAGLAGCSDEKPAEPEKPAAAGPSTPAPEAKAEVKPDAPAPAAEKDAAPTAAADAGGASDEPNYERPVGGVLPKNSGFTASSIIACEREGTGAAQCDAGVVREGNGKGFVMVFWPDAGNRVLYFENGEIVGYDQSEADGGAELSVKREGDIQKVTIGSAKFEIFDALLVGG